MMTAEQIMKVFLRRLHLHNAMMSKNKSGSSNWLSNQQVVYTKRSLVGHGGGYQLLEGACVSGTADIVRRSVVRKPLV